MLEWIAGTAQRGLFAAIALQKGGFDGMPVHGCEKELSLEFCDRCRVWRRNRDELAAQSAPGFSVIMALAHVHDPSVICLI